MDQEAQQFNRASQRSSGLKTLAILGLIVLVSIIGTVSVTNYSSMLEKKQKSNLIVQRQFNMQEAMMYSRILSVCLNFDHSMKEEQSIKNSCELEAIQFTLYPLKENDYSMKFALTIDDSKKLQINDTSKAAIQKLSYNDFPQTEKNPLPEIFYLTLNKKDMSFDKLKNSNNIKEETQEKIRQLMIQITPEMKEDIYRKHKQIKIQSNLGIATPNFEILSENNDELTVTKYYDQDMVEDKKAELSLGNNEYTYRQLTSFNKNEQVISKSILEEDYHYESQPNDVLALGFDIKIYSKMEYIKKVEIKQEKRQQLLKQKSKASKVIKTLYKEIELIQQQSAENLAQKIKENLLVEGAQDRIVTNDFSNDVTTIHLVHQEIQVYQHKKQTLLGFDFTINDVIDIYQNTDFTDIQGIMETSFLFENKLVFTVARHGCSQDINLFKIQTVLNSSLEADMAAIEAIPEQFMVGLQNFVLEILQKYQAFIGQFKKNDFTRTSTQNTFQNSENLIESRRKSETPAEVKKKIEDFINNLKTKIVELDKKIQKLLNDSKAAHFNKQVSYSYPLSLDLVTITFSFDLTFGMDASYQDNLATLYDHNKLVFENYIDIIKRDYSQEVDAAKEFVQQLRVDLEDAKDLVKEFQLSPDEKIILQWDCSKDTSDENDDIYVCVNGITKDIKKVSQAYHDQLQKEIDQAKGKLKEFLEHVESFEKQQIEYFESVYDKLKYFWQKRKELLYDKLNFTFQPVVQGDIYIQGSASIRFATPLPIFDMSISVHGYLLSADASASVAINAKLIITQLFNLIKTHPDLSTLTPAQKSEFQNAVSDDVKVQFHIDIKGVDMTVSWTSSSLIYHLLQDIIDLSKDIFTKIKSSNDEMYVLPNRRKLELSDEQNGIKDWILKKQLEKFFSSTIKSDLQKLESDIDLLLDDLFCDFLIGKFPFEIGTVSKDLMTLNWFKFDCELPWVGILDLRMDKVKCNFSPKFEVKILV